MKKVSVAVKTTYIDDFMEVLVDMKYRIGTITPSHWCLWVDVLPAKGSKELSDDDLDIIKMVKCELRDLV